MLRRVTVTYLNAEAIRVPMEARFGLHERLDAPSKSFRVQMASPILCFPATIVTQSAGASKTGTPHTQVIETPTEVYAYEQGVEIEMQAKDIMTTTIVSVSSENSVRHAAEIMLINHVSGLPVIDDNGVLVGIISEGDLIRRTELGSEAIISLANSILPAEERAFAFLKRSSWRVGDAMSRNPIVIDEETSLAHISKLMQEHGIKRVPVARNGELIGIVSRADLLKAIIMAELDETAVGDEALRRSIVVRLGEDTGLEDFDVKVTVSDGIVHLWGDVTTEECRRAACVVAENVHGVRGVVDHFSQPPS